MPDVLRRGVAAWRMELRLVCWTWWYPALLLAWSALVAYVFRDYLLISPEAALNQNLRGFSIGLASLAALMLGAAGAGRGQRTRFAALDESYPTGTELTLGRWLAGVTALLPTQAAAVAIAGRAGPAASLWRVLPTFLMEATITFAFATAVGWLLITVVGPRRWVYPLLAGGWLGCLGLPFFFNQRNLDNPAMRLLDFMRSDSGIYEELWGRLLEGALPERFNLFYAGLAALFVALVVARTCARRRRRAPLVPAAFALAALVLAGWSATGYVGQLYAWEAQAVDLATVSRPGSDDLKAAPVEAIDAWEIAVDLTDPASPSFDARFTLRNAGSEPITTAAVTLHRDVEISLSTLPYERDGDVLRLALPEPLGPGETRDLRLVYGGPISTFVSWFYPMPVSLAFTAEDGVRLPLFGGWYPLPGEEPVAPDWAGVLHPPARFDLSVTLPAGWGVFSNLPASGETTFAADDATWAVLYASPRLRTEQVGTTTVIAPEALMAKARTLVPAYEAVMAEFARVFPGPAPEGLTLAILDTFTGLPAFTPPVGRQPLVVISQQTPDDLTRNAFNRRYFVGTALAEDLWCLSGGNPEPPSMFHAVQQFLWERHVAGDDPERFQQDATAFGDDELLPVVMALREIEAEGGEAAVRGVIARMIAEQETLYQMELPEMVAWIEETARAR